MDKILLVINAHQPDVYSTDFACSIASLLRPGLPGFLLRIRIHGTGLYRY